MFTIYYTDGSKLTGSTIEFGYDGNIIVDEYRIVPICDIVRIVAN